MSASTTDCGSNSVAGWRENRDLLIAAARVDQFMADLQALLGSDDIRAALGQLGVAVP